MSKSVSAFSGASTTFGTWTNETAGPIPAGTPFTITDTGSTFMANSIIIFFHIASSPVISVQSITPDSAAAHPGHGHGGSGTAGSITVVASQAIPMGYTVFFAVINPAA
ncbi:MAG TPA: hypothetical protein VFJ29_00625 [Candidatus Kapabacteria bacterium]|nr:hypothetical protein [Candidatus Kapabacteria bacterium]